MVVIHYHNKPTIVNDSLTNYGIGMTWLFCTWENGDGNFNERWQLFHQGNHQNWWSTWRDQKVPDFQTKSWKIYMFLPSACHGNRQKRMKSSCFAFFLVISVSQHLKVPGRWGNMAVALRTVRPWGVGTGDLRTMAKGLRSWCIQPKLWRHPGTSSLRRKSLTDWHPVHSPAVETIALEALFAKSLVDFRGEFWPLAFTNSLFLESLPALGFWALKSTWLVDFPFTQRSDRSQSDQMHRAVAIYHPKSWTQLDLTDSNAIPPVMSSSAIWGPV